MSERLKRFRKLMSAFEGTSNPQRAIEQGYYVDLPNNPMKDIVRRIEVRPVSMYVLLGGIGSGKTTQLLRTQNHLNQLEDFNAIYVDVSLYTDISHLAHGLLLIVAGLELTKFLSAKNQSDFRVEQHFQLIYNLAYGNKKNGTQIPRVLQKLQENLENELQKHITWNIAKPTEDPDKFQISQQLIEVYKLSHSITTSNTNQDNQEKSQGLLSNPQKEITRQLIDSFSVLSKIATEKNGEVVFIFDGLDRVTEPEKFTNYFLKEAEEILHTGIGVVLVGSTPMRYYSDIENFSSHLHFFPYLNIFDDEYAREFFINILMIRDPDNSILREVKEFLIIQSGGVLRDLMSLTQFAIEEAYVDGSDNVQLEHAEQAADSLGYSKFAVLDEYKLNIINHVLSQKDFLDFLPRATEALDLLLTGHILEYSYPRRYFSVHPVLVRFLKNRSLEDF